MLLLRIILLLLPFIGFLSVFSSVGTWLCSKWVCVIGELLFFFSFFFFHDAAATATLDLAASVIYTAAWGNARSLTHWVRPGIDLSSSWTLCRVLNLLSHNGNFGLASFEGQRGLLFECEAVCPQWSQKWPGRSYYFSLQSQDSDWAFSTSKRYCLEMYS